MQVALLTTGPATPTLSNVLAAAGHHVVTTVPQDPTSSYRDTLGPVDVVILATFRRRRDGRRIVEHPERLVERAFTQLATTPTGRNDGQRRCRRSAPHRRPAGLSPTTTLLVAGNDRDARASIEQTLRHIAAETGPVVDVGRLDQLCDAAQRPHRTPHAATPTRTTWHDYWPVELTVQAALIIGAALTYFAVRALTEGAVDDAVRHGHDVLSFEAGLGIDIEAAVQGYVLEHPTVTTLANWIYIWGHWPVIAASSIWLHRSARAQFFLLRNAMFISGAIGLVIFATYPVAPPRHLPDGFVDTVTELSRSYRVLQPPQLINEYAAVPSLHVGWNLLVGIILFQSSHRRSVRVVAVTGPALMAAAVVATANHYVVDAVAGSAIALIGLAGALLIRHAGQRPHAAPRTAPALPVSAREPS